MKTKFASITHKEFFEEQMKDPDFARQYAESEEEFKALRAAIDARLAQKLTQEDMAKRLNTTRSAICRFEAGLFNGRIPTLAMLKKYANALGKRIEIRLV